MKESSLSTTEENQLKKTKIKRNTSDIFFQGPNTEKMGIHEDSLTSHHHSGKENTKLNLGTKYFPLEKVKESQRELNEEISEEISKRQKKQHQEALSILSKMKELEIDGLLLTEQFPWEGYTNWQPLTNKNCNMELHKNIRRGSSMINPACKLAGRNKETKKLKKHQVTKRNPPKKKGNFFG
ncbi:hypothetical protein O181_004404 [Austropuccinia psidii MF-1]|uniref:Uncharacterized protein n=1 Tax=Austropuccinia psidii MF-1 TaxID=1389203 RepID=A0A9Q3BG60_9BASI|nr:hypothetical protein [Austropuccinia psidii MF-1]